MSQVDALKADIVELVVEHWSSENSAMLLSQLGQLLDRRGHEVKRILAGGRLSAFIANELDGKVRTVPSPEDAKVIGAVPASVEDAEICFPRKADAAGVTPRTTFDRRVWAAFSVPIPDGLTRTLTLEPEIRFDHVHPEAAQASGKLVVERDSVLPVGEVGAAERAALLVERISNWAAANGVSIDQLKPRSAASRPAQNSLLHQLIEHLEPGELARVSLPLDVVAKLLRQSSR